MRTRSLPPRLAATAVVMAAAGAFATSPASAAVTAGTADEPAYHLTVAADPAATDYDHRHADVTVTLAKADGTPVPNAPVRVGEVLIFNTWNPWGDPIDPIYTEATQLGTPTTDADGKITIPQVLVDHTTDSSLLASAHEVEFSAVYDVDGDDNTWNDTYVNSTYLRANTVSSTVSFHVNKTKVQAGDILTVDGTVNLPRGQEPQGTEVFLRTYWEGEYRVKTVAEDDGSFVLSAKIRDYDDEFVLMTAPRDYYTSGRVYELPVTNTSLP